MSEDTETQAVENNTPTTGLATPTFGLLIGKLAYQRLRNIWPKQTCADCRLWTAVEGDPATGTCHRHPPTVISVSIPVGPKGDKVENRMITPNVTSAHMWRCGEFRRRWKWLDLLRGER